MIRIRIGVAAAVLLALTCAVILGHQANSNYERYGVYALAPGSDTPRLKFGGRYYVRNEIVDVLKSFYVRLGSAPGHGTIYGYQPKSGLVNVELVVAYPDGHLRSYGLQGGP